MKKFNYRIDNMRALAIILVVYAHSIIIYSGWNLLETEMESPFFDMTHKIIALCHMPIFLFISGYLFAGRLNAGDLGTLVRDKFRRVLIPYFVVAFLWMIPIRMLVRLPQYQDADLFTVAVRGILFGQDNGHLWYLITVFLAYISSYVYCRCLRLAHVNEKHAVLIIFILSVFLARYRSLFNSVPAVGEILYRYAGFYVFFCFGMLGGVYDMLNSSIFERMCRYRAIAVLILTLLLYLHVNRIYRSRILTGLVSALTAALIMPDRKIDILSKISRESFGIYLFHSPLIYITFTFIPNIPPVLMFIINFFGFGSLAMFMYMGLSRTPVRYLIGLWK